MYKLCNNKCYEKGFSELHDVVVPEMKIWIKNKNLLSP